MNLTPKKILLAVASALALGTTIYVINSYSKEQLKEDALNVATDVASTVGAKAIDYGKQKLQEHIDKRNEEVAGAVVSSGAVISEGVPEIEQIIDDGGMEVKRTKFIEVEHPEFINLDSLSIKSKDADKMLQLAISNLDVERVKYLLDSGVSIEFTEDYICYDNTYRTGSGLLIPTTQKYLPRTTEEIKSNFFDFDIARTYNTECSKIVLPYVLKHLKAIYADAEIIKDELHTPRDVEYEKESYIKAKRIYEMLMSNIPKKDYYQFRNYLNDSELASEIRYDLLDKYLDYFYDPIYHPNREAFLELYKQSAIELYEEMRDKEKVRRQAERINLFLHSQDDFNMLVEHLISGYADFYQHMDTFDMARERESQIEDILSQVVIPQPTIKTLNKNYIPYKVENLETEIRRTHTIGIPLVNLNFYYANKQLQFINRVHNDERVKKDRNYWKSISEDSQIDGGLAHYLVRKNPEYSHSIRPRALLVRYLLNEGYIDPNTLDKDGQTAHGLMLALIQRNYAEYGKVVNKELLSEDERKYGHERSLKELEKAFLNKNYE